MITAAAQPHVDAANLGVWAIAVAIGMFAILFPDRKHKVAARGIGVLLVLIGVSLILHDLGMVK